LAKTSLKNLARAIGRAIGRVVLDKRSAAPLALAKNILVIRWDGKLGDAVVSSFFYEEAEKLGKVTVTVITTPELALLHRRHFGVHRVLTTQPNPGLIELCRLRRQLGYIDTVIHLVGRIRTRELLFLYFLKPHNVFSLDDDICRVNGKMRKATANLSFSQKYAFVLRQLGVSEVDSRYRVPLSSAREGVTLTENVGQSIVFNPFASRADKSLGVEKATGLLRFIADRVAGCEISILYSPDTLDQAIAMERAAGRSNVRVAEGITTLFDAIAAVSGTMLVISVDTSIMHIADGLHKKLIAICPQHGNQFNPWLPRPALFTRVVWSPQDLHRYSRTGKKDMDNFSDCEVLDSLEALISTNGSADFLSLEGKIVSGMGVASRNLKLQLPLIAQEFPEILVCHYGSINVEFPCALNGIVADYRSPPLAWVPDRPGTEVFEFLRIGLTLPGYAHLIPAWLYIPQRSPHRKTPHIHEIIAPKLDLQGANAFAIKIDKRSIRTMAPVLTLK